MGVCVSGRKVLVLGELTVDGVLGGGVGMEMPELEAQR